MRNITLFTLALASLVGCTSESFTGTDDEARLAQGETAITFGFDVPAVTRASGSEAATALGNQFIVYGEKSETASAPATGNLVFPNYKVTYGANTAYTTTSNTKDWEYVGTAWTAAEAANIKMNSTAVTTNDQTIKYWDYAATGYTFTAVSAKSEDISSGKVIIDKVTSGTTVYDKGYTVTVTDEADLGSLYFADRVNITSSADKDRTASNQYGGNVTFTFRNSVSKVRVGMFETIPGYEVKVTKFYYADAAAPAFTAMTSENTTNFVANVPNVSPVSGKTSVAGTFTVKYYEKNTANDAANISNHPTISFAPTAPADRKNYITLGSNVCNTTLATSAAAPTFDNTTEDNYTTVFPQENNSTNLKLKIDYQLRNTVTGELINITGKTAEVPAQYLKWKPNYKYTYLFKITDDDLYPITFDAVVIEAENGKAEYITTVSEPSITTYAKGSNVTTDGDYKSGATIYATVMDGSTLATLSADNMKLYTVTTTDGTNFPITEASVAEAIAEYTTLNTAGQTAAKIKCTASAFTYGKTVVAEDGSTLTMDASNNVVASFTGAAISTPSSSPQYYAIQYEKTPATYSYGEGKNDYTSVTFAAAGTLYTRTGDAYTEATTWTDGTTYYKRTGVTNIGVYAYKIVKVVP